MVCFKRLPTLVGDVLFPTSTSYVHQWSSLFLFMFVAMWLSLVGVVVQTFPWWLQQIGRSLLTNTIFPICCWWCKVRCKARSLNEIFSCKPICLWLSTLYLFLPIFMGFTQVTYCSLFFLSYIGIIFVYVCFAMAYGCSCSNISCLQ
jgi:hypothetical protein